MGRSRLLRRPRPHSMRIAAWAVSVQRERVHFVVPPPDALPPAGLDEGEHRDTLRFAEHAVETGITLPWSGPTTATTPCLVRSSRTMSVWRQMCPASPCGGARKSNPSRESASRTVPRAWSPGQFAQCGMVRSRPAETTCWSSGRSTVAPAPSRAAKTATAKPAVATAIGHRHSAATLPWCRRWRRRRPPCRRTQSRRRRRASAPRCADGRGVCCACGDVRSRRRCGGRFALGAGAAGGVPFLSARQDRVRGGGPRPCWSEGAAIRVRGSGRPLQPRPPPGRADQAGARTSAMAS